MLAPTAVLALSLSNCPACASWERELRAWLATGDVGPDTRVGKLVLDSEATAEFKRDNEWLDEVPGLPFTAVFVDGEPRTSLAGGGLGRLERRLEILGRTLENRSERAANVPPNREPGAQAPLTALSAETTTGG